MPKILHVLGIIIGYGVAITSIVIGATGAVPDFPGWKFMVVGLAFALCATIALLDGARVMPSIGWFKAKAKFKGLSDLGFILIFGILLITSLVFIFA